MNLQNEYWTGCYSGNFDMITPDSFAHPAKMAPQLCYRIIEHLEELGFLKTGMTIFDPMSGTGLTAICSNAKGYKAITVELEEKFVGFQKANKEYAGRKLGKELDWQIIHGDSRKLSQLLSERGLVTVSSPPYAGGTGHGGTPTEFDKRIGLESWVGEQYGNTPGQIENLPDKPLTVTSPPYEKMFNAKQHTVTDMAIEKSLAYGGYGESKENIGNSETYLSAMRQVYAEIAKVSDVCVVVTKNPTRNGKLRRLDEDTVALLKEVGFSILCQHKAVLFEEHETQDLFGNKTKKVKGRMSFFKRLSYQKGSPVAAWDDVIFAVKAGTAGLVTVSSPPYCDAQSGGGISAAMRGEGNYNVSTSMPGSAYQPSEHGRTPGQIGNLKDR